MWKCFYDFYALIHSQTFPKKPLSTDNTQAKCSLLNTSSSVLLPSSRIVCRRSALPYKRSSLKRAVGWEEELQKSTFPPGIMEPVFAALLHPCAPAAMAAALCLRTVCIALPNLLTPLINRAETRLVGLSAYYNRHTLSQLKLLHEHLIQSKIAG